MEFGNADRSVGLGKGQKFGHRPKVQSLKECTEFKAGQGLEQPPWTKMRKCEYHRSRYKQRLIVGSAGGSGISVGDLLPYSCGDWSLRARNVNIGRD